MADGLIGTNKNIESLNKYHEENKITFDDLRK